MTYVPPKSWIARVYATAHYEPGTVPAYRHLLLGGVRETRSSRFETNSMAVRFAEQAVETNIGAGRPAAYQIEGSDHEPEIMMDRKLCQIQWVDDKGVPTPDENPAIGTAQCMGHPCEGNPNFRPEPSRKFPICADHLKRMPSDGVWVFEPFAD